MTGFFCSFKFSNAKDVGYKINRIPKNPFHKCFGSKLHLIWNRRNKENSKKPFRQVLLNNILIVIIQITFQQIDFFQMKLLQTLFKMIFKFFDLTICTTMKMHQNIFKIYINNHIFVTTFHAVHNN